MYQPEALPASGKHSKSQCLCALQPNIHLPFHKLEGFKHLH